MQSSKKWPVYAKPLNQWIFNAKKPTKNSNVFRVVAPNTMKLL